MQGLCNERSLRITEVDINIWNEIPDEYTPVFAIYTANQWGE